MPSWPLATTRWRLHRRWVTTPSASSPGYALLSGTYDELFAAPDTPRRSVQALSATLGASRPDDFARSQALAEMAMLTRGVTFSVYADHQRGVPTRTGVVICSSPLPLNRMPWQRQVLQPYLLPPELPESELEELMRYAMRFVRRNQSDLQETLLDLNPAVFTEHRYRGGRKRRTPGGRCTSPRSAGAASRPHQRRADADRSCAGGRGTHVCGCDADERDDRCGRRGGDVEGGGGGSTGGVTELRKR